MLLQLTEHSMVSMTRPKSLHGIAHVRVVESALLPALCHITGQRQAAVLAAYPFGMLSQILRKPLLPVGKGEEEAHLAFLKAF